MVHMGTHAAARTLRAVCILASLSVAAAITYAVETGVAATNVPSVKSSAASSSASISASKTTKPVVKPLWIELTPAQQQALAPLSTEWDKLDSFRKNKWLAIGNKYASMKPDEQQRVQERMRDWVKLTPEQRRIARESYARTKKMNSDQKSAHWEQYQQLPEEQKKKLAADAASKKHVANLPSAAQSKTKTVPPIKSAPKPVLEQSVTPQATNQSALQPSTPPANK